MTHLLTHPNIASRAWVIEQYDSMVGTVNMHTNQPSDAGVVYLKGTEKALALTTDCNSRYVWADPEKGTAIAVAEAARNIICAGGSPSAITNCLNFGNPYNPSVYWQFVGAVKGMGRACEKFGTPVTGGNVSFYNQSQVHGKEEAVFPTPVIGMLGIIEDKSHFMTFHFKNEGDHIYLIGKSVNDIACSEYLYSYRGVKKSPAPYFDIDEEYAVHKAVSKLILQGAVNAVHDCSDGGLFIALAEMGMKGKLGFDVATDDSLRTDAFLFGEAQGRVLVSLPAEEAESFVRLMKEQDCPYTQLGKVTTGDCIINGRRYAHIDEWKQLYDNTLAGLIE
ncbi:MAG: AIR synthase related protein, partial [Flavobacteriales bacterium]